MVYQETVAPKTLDLIKRLSGDKNLEDFHLVGGTALSLKIGHRISVDIDLFSDNPFDSKQLAFYLESSYSLKNISVLQNGIFCFIDEIKVDLLTHQYPWVNAPTRRN